MEIIRLILIGYSISIALVLYSLLTHLKYKKYESVKVFHRFLDAKREGIENLYSLRNEFRKFYYNIREFKNKEPEKYQLLKFLEFPIQMYSENMIVRDVIETILPEWKKLYGNNKQNNT